MERDLYQIMIFSDTYPKVSHYVYLRDFDNSERNMFVYLLEEIIKKRAFSVDLPSRFHRGAFIVTGGVFIGYYRGPNLEEYVSDKIKFISPLDFFLEPRNGVRPKTLI